MRGVSSHQLNMVEDICEEVAIIDRGRVVLAGEVPALKAAGARSLVVEVADAEPGWLDGLGRAAAPAPPSGCVRLALDGLDPQDVLDRARAAGRVTRFAVEEPSLLDLFLQAVA